MKVVLVLLLGGVIAANCNPIDKEGYEKITKQLAALTKRVADLKKEVKDVKKAKEETTTNSLKDSLEAAVLADSKHDVTVTANDASKEKEVLAESDAILHNDKENEQLFNQFEDNNDVNADEDDLWGQIDEKSAVKDHGKATPEKHKSQSKKKREEVKFLKDSLNKIKKTVKDMKKEFTKVESLYVGTVKDEPLDKRTKGKFQTIKEDMEDVINGIHELSTQMIDGPGDMEDESVSDVPNEDTFALLSLMEKELKEAADAIKDLQKLRGNRKRKMEASKDNKEETGVGIPITEIATDNISEDMKMLISLKDQVKGVILEMKDIKKSIDKRQKQSA